MILSTTVKESIKTALAMTIAFGIALSLDWDKAYWAAFAVAFVSLGPVGQSVNRAAMRMLGTLMGVVIALIIISLFAQDRWMFMLFLSLWLGVCTYMLAGPGQPYNWHVAGFVSAIICMDAGQAADGAFALAVSRCLETMLGVVVYSLVTIFLWPSRSNFGATVVSMVSAHHRLFSSYLAVCLGEAGDQSETQRLRGEVMQAKASFAGVLAAAEIDDHEVWEHKAQWLYYQRLDNQMVETMERWREGFADTESLKLRELLPGFDRYAAELASRLEGIEKMLSGHAPASELATIELHPSAAAEKLTPFERSALTTLRARMQRMETVAGELFECVSAIKGFGAGITEAKAAPPTRAPFVLDLDRFRAALVLMLVMWMAWVAMVYVEGLPGGAGFLGLMCSLGMVLAINPQLPVSKLFRPVTVSVFLACIAYLFIMPHLTRFYELGILIFVMTFGICYRYSSPAQGLGRAAGLALFVTIASITNQQSYSFLSVATAALMFVIMFLLAYIPFTPQPERRFRNLLNRFFSSASYLMAINGAVPARSMSPLQRWKLAFHTYELSTLPQKLQGWAPQIKTRANSADAQPHALALVGSLQTLGYKMQELLEERRVEQSPVLEQALREDVLAWKAGVHSIIQRLSEGTETVEIDSLSLNVSSFLDRLEKRISGVLEASSGEPLSSQQGEDFYRLLGAFRGVTDALVDYVGCSQNVPWHQWKEGRFI
ncbi:FUSC family protein [Aestuariirhabdus sp. LZHN29]|uniref:FUSC family protein n=1 Tax=Aestuariirhabdus sp. LZHN29 TaxID=3417462 RepID=UPI003CEA7976